TIKWTPVAILLFIMSLGATYWLFKTVPTGFIPNEDQGWFITMIQGPEGVSLNYTVNVLKQVEKVFDKQPEIRSSFGVAGFSFSGNKPNNALVFANLHPWAERRARGHTLDDVIEHIRGPLSGITDATVVPFNPPAIQGLGNFGGFVFEVEDQTGGDISVLGKATRDLCRLANQNPVLRGVFSSFSASSPQLVVKVDRDKAKALGVALSDVFTTLQAFLGSVYINDIDIGTRVYRVYAQADQLFRQNPRDIGQFYVKSARGMMVPLSSLVQVERTSAPQGISHYNLFRSTEIVGSTAPGASSGQAMKAMESIADKVLPQGMTYEWSGISLEQIEAGEKSLAIFALGILFVFLVLAAQFESFSDPFVILLAVPGAMMGALLAQWLRGLQNDVFCQIGLVMLIGLVSKNSILIVEFANQLRDRGMPIVEAAIQASEIRLRPILMTTFAFVMGILPLVFAEGAGAASRRSLGTAVCGGMLISSLLSLYIVPVIYVSLESLIHRRRGNSGGSGEIEPAGRADPELPAAGDSEPAASAHLSS
ncbi:MAG TPA: efflux RND transporter permease subunit, partial [Chroococcales cyanobacterium]